MNWLNWLGTLLGCGGTMAFASLAYALHDYSRTRLTELLEKRGKAALADMIGRLGADLIFSASLGRLLCNIMLLVSLLGGLGAFHDVSLLWTSVSVLACALLLAVFSVALPAVIARHRGENVLASLVGLLLGMRLIFWPLIKFTHQVDAGFRRLFGVSLEPQPQRLEDEILSAVEEGQKDGLVGEAEREMIESVIDFRDRQAGQIMTARPEMIGLPVESTLADTRRVLEESGLSRLPVYDGTLDQILGVLYARDLLKLLGQSEPAFDLRQYIRPAYYVPETKLLRDLLQDFRVQKVHMAIVLDEYGGTAGLVTIEDVLEELVGDISDEHEPAEPAMLKRIDDCRWEADARVHISELNEQLGLKLDEDAGYATLGGLVTTKLGRIPEPGAMIEEPGARYVVLDAEPQKIKLVRIELIETDQPASTSK